MEHTSSPTEAHDPELELVAVSFRAVEFRLRAGDGERSVTVLVGSGSTWRRAVRYPHGLSEHGESTDDDELDERIRRRAAEEVVRMAGAVSAIQEAKAAA